MRVVMGLLEKLENLINKMLLHLGEVFARFMLKIIPAPVMKVFHQTSQAMVWLKNLPMLIVKSAPKLIASAKDFAKGFDFKAKFKETQSLAMAQYLKSQESGSAKLTGFKKTLLMPFLMMEQWVKGLSMTQGFFLFSFTMASFFAVAGMIYTGNQLYAKYQLANRAPASVEVVEEIKSDRPDYYKQQNRSFSVSSLRLPVFFGNLGQLRSIDVDFNATLSNRMARMKLEKLEFQLRDHLILQVEPMSADFPLAEEGKDILKDKILREVNDFMKANDIEGEVQEVKLTYILAN
jgi:flagellar basal body-associated protein FliL